MNFRKFSEYDRNATVLAPHWCRLRPNLFLLKQMFRKAAGVRSVCIILHRMIFLMAPTGVDIFCRLVT